MVVVIIHYPPIKQGKDEEFREWFAWSNQEFSSYKGFISRRLLKPINGGNYVGIVEHESSETFTVCIIVLYMTKSVSESHSCLTVILLPNSMR